MSSRPTTGGNCTYLLGNDSRYLQYWPRFFKTKLYWWCNRRFFKVGGPMINLLENVRKRRTKILVMLAANQMNEQPLENTFVPQDQDLGHWSSYLKKRLITRMSIDRCLGQPMGKENQIQATDLDQYCIVTPYDSCWISGNCTWSIITIFLRECKMITLKLKRY